MQKCWSVCPSFTLLEFETSSSEIAMLDFVISKRLSGNGSCSVEVRPRWRKSLLGTALDVDSFDPRIDLYSTRQILEEAKAVSLKRLSRFGMNHVALSLKEHDLFTKLHFHLYTEACAPQRKQPRWLLSLVLPFHPVFASRLAQFSFAKIVWRITRGRLFYRNASMRRWAIHFYLGSLRRSPILRS